MASKLPIVSTDIESISCLINNGYNGILCKLNDERSFSDNLRKLILDKKLRSTLGSNAYRTILKFDWKEVIKAYKELYDHI